MANGTAALQAATDFASQADIDCKAADANVASLVASLETATVAAGKALTVKVGADAGLEAMKLAAGVTTASPSKLGEYALAAGLGLALVLGGLYAVAHYVLQWV